MTLKGKISFQRKKTRGSDAILGNANIQGLNVESDAGESEKGWSERQEESEERIVPKKAGEE